MSAKPLDSSTLADAAGAVDFMHGIVASTAEGIVSIDETLRIVLFNPAAEKMFGRSSAEMNGQPLSALIPERFRAPHDEHIRGFAATGQTNRAMGRYGLIFGLRAQAARNSRSRPRSRRREHRPTSC